MPGWNWVPRWRTMMLPASIAWPIDLHAEILRVGVAAVARGTYALFMCHGCFSLLLVATGDAGDLDFGVVLPVRSEEHTSELQSLMRTSYAVFCLKKKNTK